MTRQHIVLGFEYMFGKCPETIKMVDAGCRAVRCTHEMAVDIQPGLEIRFNGQLMTGAIDISTTVVPMFDIGIQCTDGMIADFHIGLCGDCGKGYCSSW